MFTFRQYLDFNFVGERYHLAAVTAMVPADAALEDCGDERVLEWVRGEIAEILGVSLSEVRRCTPHRP